MPGSAELLGHALASQTPGLLIASHGVAVHHARQVLHPTGRRAEIIDQYPGLSTLLPEANACLREKEQWYGVQTLIQAANTDEIKAARGAHHVNLKPALSGIEAQELLEASLWLGHEQATRIKNLGAEFRREYKGLAQFMQKLLTNLTTNGMNETMARRRLLPMQNIFWLMKGVVDLRLARETVQIG